MKECTGVGVPHPDFGETALGLIVPEAQGAPDPHAIAAAVEGSLAGFKHPRNLLVVDSVPRNAMGQVQQATLRATFAGIFGDG